MKRKNELNNKGFSLVELIIVIAIMAILIGVMAPNLMRFVERTRVSNDTQVINTLRTAVVVAMADPNVGPAKIGTTPTTFNTRSNITGIGDDAAPVIALTIGMPEAEAESADAADIVAFIRRQLRAATSEGRPIEMRITGGQVAIWIEGTLNNETPQKEISVGTF